MESPTSSYASVPSVSLAQTLPAPSRCLQCNPQRKDNTRNLIVCIDDASNRFGQNENNVAKLFNMVKQLSSYPQQYAYPFQNGTGRTFNWAISDEVDVICKTYSWLVENYREGDQIYLFGFSGSAYQVLHLEGMIHEVGLIRTSEHEQIRKAYDHYEVICSGKPKPHQMARAFHDKLFCNGRVHFVGLWDTVCTGEIIRSSVFPSTARRACHYRHALALDELQSKFMPEYIHEINLDYSKSKSGGDADVSENKTTPDIKEVWFAGSHSDIGGIPKPGITHQAGNVSLLWMRREAAANGLALEATDSVWLPDDLDFGVSDSMTFTWPANGYHDVSVSSASEVAQRLRRLHPRRVIPGQKVHASVLFADVYAPKATLGMGFDIPIVQPGLEDPVQDNNFWETELFDDTAAQELVASLTIQRSAAQLEVYLDRLLFMLRFERGKQYVRNVPKWKETFLQLIDCRSDGPLVWLFALAVYYEASCEHESDPDCRPPLTPQSFPKIFDDAKNFLVVLLTANNRPQHLRMARLLRPLTKHPGLRLLLTQDILEKVVKYFDFAFPKYARDYGQAVDCLTCLNCLLQCELTRGPIVQKLQLNPQNSKVSRLSRILEVDDLRLLTAGLQLVLTLARIPEDGTRKACSIVKPRIEKLAGKDDRLVGPLAVEILLALQTPNNQVQLNFRDAHVRANLASVLVRSPGNPEDPVQKALHHLFGHAAQQISEFQKMRITELKKDVEKGHAWERSLATRSLLKLCDSNVVRRYLREINLLEVFVDQLRHKECALLAAHALATCFNHGDMRDCIPNLQNLPEHIAGMIREDYFDDAVGLVEGFQILRDLMRQRNELLNDLASCTDSPNSAESQEKLNADEIFQVLETKLGKGKPKETRTSLVCLDIVRSFESNYPWTEKLVEHSLRHLKSPKWIHQNMGVAILFALAQTEHGVVTISPRLGEIVQMLLPEAPSMEPQAIPANTTSPPSPPAATAAGSTDPHTSLNTPSGQPSMVMAPACALFILARNGKDTAEPYLPDSRISHIEKFLSIRNVNDKSKPRRAIFLMRISTLKHIFFSAFPTEVADMLDKVLKATEGGLPNEEQLLVGARIIPHVTYWDRFTTKLGDGAVNIAGILPLISISLPVIPAIAILTPVHLSVRFFQELLSRHQDNRVMNNLRPAQEEHQDRTPGSVFHRHDEELDDGGRAPEA